MSEPKGYLINPKDFGYTAAPTSLRIPEGWMVTSVGRVRKDGDRYCMGGTWLEYDLPLQFTREISPTSQVNIRKVSELAESAAPEKAAVPAKATGPVDAAKVVVVRDNLSKVPLEVRGNLPEVPPEIFQTINEALSREWTAHEIAIGRIVGTKHLRGPAGDLLAASIIRQYEVANWRVKRGVAQSQCFTFYPCKIAQT